VRRMRRTILWFAAAGFFLALALYFGITFAIGTDDSVPARIRTAVSVLCPGILLFSTLDVDIRPYTKQFYELALMFALANSGAYGILGAVYSGIRRIRQRKADPSLRSG